MKRTPLKRKSGFLKRTKLRVAGHSSEAQKKVEIQRLVREIVMARDGTCVLRGLRHCNDPVMQADHLITRANSATYADTRLIVCLCRSCHGWKRWNEKEYDIIVKKVLSKERIRLWERCEEERLQHKGRPQDWSMHILALTQELKRFTLE